MKAPRKRIKPVILYVVAKRYEDAIAQVNEAFGVRPARPQSKGTT